MKLNTASEGITLANKLENESAEFYEGLAQKYVKEADTFLSFAKENKKNVVNLQRTYFGVITDAIEGCFCFDLDPDEYTLETKLTKETGYSDVLRKALGMEEKIIKFYSDAAEQGRSLMADVPRAFILVAKKRSSRLEKLKELLEEEQTISRDK